MILSQSDRIQSLLSTHLVALKRRHLVGQTHQTVLCKNIEVQVAKVVFFHTWSVVFEKVVFMSLKINEKLALLWLNISLARAKTFDFHFITDVTAYKVLTIDLYLKYMRV